MRQAAQGLRRLLLAPLAALLVLATAHGAPLAGSVPDTGSARLVSEVKSVAAGSTFIAAFHIELPKHWHTYWRFAGDSGAPPALKWKLPPGFKAGDILWPVPSRIAIPPFTDFGYEGTVDFMVPITAPASLAPGESLPLALHADWLVCSEQVCIPRSGEFALELQTSAANAPPARDPEWAPVLTRAAEKITRPAPFSVSLIADKGTLELYAHNEALSRNLKSGAVRRLEFYPYTDGIINHSAAQHVLAGADGAAVRVPSGYHFEEGTAPDPLPGLLVIERKDGTRTGYEVLAHHGQAVGGLAPVVGTGGKDVTRNGLPLIVAAAFAFLGGLILNLMPCVFPVLSMKILGFLRSERQPGDLRRQGWLYTAGVMASFLALGAGLYFLRAGGAALGWGYQLQSPVALLFLAYLMFAIGLSLLGVLTIGSGAAGIGQGLVARGGGFSDFMTGVLVTIVATPCTAPFMGAALGYALLAPPLDGAAVFFALGAGVALPYLALTHVPRALRVLPKAGAWMERLKQILAAPMLASCAWLLYVLAQQVSTPALIAALAGLALIAFGAWALRGAPGRAWSGRIAVVLALVTPVAFVWLPTPARSGRADLHKMAEGDWVPYSRGRLDAALASGQPVFVDVTADWCLTCKVNEWSALSNPHAEAALKERGVIRLRADWTNRDPEITSLVTEHGRIGIPLYLFYPAGSKTAKILPQILTEDSIIAALGS